ncbi:MAG: hypothetical protein RRZ68_06530, partial [Oscillospiraceae bacterium]
LFWLYIYYLSVVFLKSLLFFVLTNNNKFKPVAQESLGAIEKIPATLSVRSLVAAKKKYNFIR